MKLYLVRHAEKEFEGENPNLTKKGIKQAKYLAKELKKRKFDVFYCSDLNRAKQTAEIVSKSIKMKPKIEPLLNEYGASDIIKQERNWSKKELARKKKMLEFVDKLVKNPDDEKNIIIIAHGITNRIIMAHLLKLPLNRLIIFRQYEACINNLSWNVKYENWNLRKMNYNGHVPWRFR